MRPLFNRGLFFIALTIGIIFSIGISARAKAYGPPELTILRRQITEALIKYFPFSRVKTISSPEIKKDSLIAQTAGFGGGSGSLVTYYKETVIGGVSSGGSLAACPSGWTEVLNGFGPHYIGIIANDWLQNGTGGAGGGFGGGGVPPPPDGIPPPPSGGIPGGGQEKDPPPAPVTGPPVLPPEEVLPSDPSMPPEPEPGITGPEPNDGGSSPPVPGPPGAPPDITYQRGETSKVASFFSNLFPSAKAEDTFRVYTAAVAIASDSVCSKAARTVVSQQTIYNNSIVSPKTRLYSEACYVDSLSGITECNRCRICVK